MHVHTGQRADTHTNERSGDLVRMLAPEPKQNLTVTVVVSILVVLAGITISLWMNYAVAQSTAEADRQALIAAHTIFSTQLKQEKESLLAMTRVIADDARIRTALATPGIDAATLEDIFKDIAQSGGVELLAVLSSRGEVQAVYGGDSLRGMDLSSSKLIGGEGKQPEVSRLWCLRPRCFVVGMVPVQLGVSADYLLLAGKRVTGDPLVELGSLLGVHGGVTLSGSLVLIGDNDSTHKSGIEAGARLPPNQVHSLTAPGGYLAWTGAVDEGLKDVRSVWIRASGHSASRYGSLPMLIWAPAIVLAVFALTYLMMELRRR